MRLNPKINQRKATANHNHCSYKEWLRERKSGCQWIKRWGHESIRVFVLVLGHFKQTFLADSVKSTYWLHSLLQFDGKLGIDFLNKSKKYLERF